MGRKYPSDADLPSHVILSQDYIPVNQSVRERWRIVPGLPP